MLGRREGGSQGLGVLRGLPQLGPRRLGASSRAPRPVRLFPTKPLRLASNLIRRTSNPPCLSQAGASLAGAARLRRGAWDSRSLAWPSRAAASAPRADRGGPGLRRRPGTGPERQAGLICSWQAPSQVPWTPAPGLPPRPLPARLAGQAAKRGGCRGAAPVPPRPVGVGHRGTGLRVPTVSQLSWSH